MRRAHGGPSCGARAAVTSRPRRCLAWPAGGWCQVAVKAMPVGSLIIGVDLAPIKPIRGVKTLLGDITTQQCRQAIRKEANGTLMDVVLHDGGPSLVGNEGCKS